MVTKSRSADIGYSKDEKREKRSTTLPAEEVIRLSVFGLQTVCQLRQGFDPSVGLCVLCASVVQQFFFPALRLGGIVIFPDEDRRARSLVSSMLNEVILNHRGTEDTEE
jgi:hypothetical protein